MKIIVTGAAGFIGYHLCKSMIDDGFEVLGIDNLNDYYDPKLKDSRLNQLGKYDNFKFEKLDISKSDPLIKVFKAFKPIAILFVEVD